MRRPFILVLCFTASITGTGCLGEPAAIEPGPAPIRRLTRFEYNNTVRDLLGDTTRPASTFGAEEEALGFNNSAVNLVTSSVLAEKYMVAAEGIAERATEPLSKNVACDPAAIGEDACAHQFIQSFGKRAFRRPITPDEAGSFYALYLVGSAETDFRTGIQLVIQAALQSPAFLYRVEFGVAPKPGDDVVRLNGWEMASRLSYLLWGSMPDDALFTAAETGRLETREEIAAQARRMLNDPRARQAVSDFHRQWLDYDRIAGVAKDEVLFPEWSPGLRDLMRQETEAFFDHVTFDDTGDLKTLLAAPYSFVDPALASFYGLPPPPGTAFEKVDRDPTQRAGILTMGSVLTAYAHSNQTSPVHRGKLVREQFFCDILDPPPPGAVIEVPEPSPTSTARERFAIHSEAPTCNTCHRLMDTLGFGFESYDAIGRFRTEENGKPINATGEIIETDDIDGKFDGAVDLAHRLSGSRHVQRCYATQWFRYAYGRAETKEDAHTMADLEAQFASSEGRIKELLVALTQTDAFLYRKIGGSR